jgi:hypothetical protein
MPSRAQERGKRSRAGMGKSVPFLTHSRLRALFCAIVVIRSFANATPAILMGRVVRTASRRLFVFLVLVFDIHGFTGSYAVAGAGTGKTVRTRVNRSDRVHCALTFNRYWYPRRINPHVWFRLQQISSSLVSVTTD